MVHAPVVRRRACGGCHAAAPRRAMRRRVADRDRPPLAASPPDRGRTVAARPRHACLRSRVWCCRSRGTRSAQTSRRRWSPIRRCPALERLLRVSAARGASTLYLSSGSRPSVRVDGELQVLDAEPVHVSRDVESLLLTLMPERSHEALRTGAATEWIVDIEGVGRVRCMSFRDHLRARRRLPPDADALGVGRSARVCRARCSRWRSSRKGSCWSPVRGRAASAR